MKTIVVESSRFYLIQLEYELSEFSQVELRGSFCSGTDALRFAEKYPVDLVFVNTSLSDMSGVSLATALRQINSGIIIIFISDNRSDVCDVLNVDADYFLLRPFNHVNIERAVNRSLTLSSRLKKRVFIKTFGSFGVFVDDVPLHFSSSKAKELLAYLVDRNGNVVDSREGFSVLWEDKSFSSSSASCYRKVLCRLLQTLDEAGVANILRVYTRGRAIDKSAVDCDYYSYLNGEREVIRKWNGEYMSNYSWGEETLAWLTENRKRYYSDFR